MISENNDFNKTLCKIYLRNQNNISELTKKVKCDFSGWHAHLRDEDGYGCDDRFFAKPLERSLSDIICVKDYVSGMTDNYAEVRYKADVDCTWSQTAWEKFNMGKKSYFDISIIA